MTTSAYDQGDILSDYLEWYLDLGVDLILVQDCNSVDGSQEILRRFARHRAVRWFILPERNMLKYDSAHVLAQRAREDHGADWIIQCDVDEFLCPLDRDLRTILADARRRDFTVITVPYFNMIGPPIPWGQTATQALTLRIDRPVVESPDNFNAGRLSVPFIFVKLPAKTIVWAEALAAYGPGSHEATSAWGRNGDGEGLRFLHYPIRGFDKFQQKVRNTAAWLADNPHLEDWWGWHWRRWIRLEREGRLREDYDNQFVSPTRAQELVHEGICATDETISRWRSHRRPAGVRGAVQGLLRSLPAWKRT